MKRDIIFEYKNIFLLGRKKFNFVESNCINKLNLNKLDYSANYIQALLYYYKKDLKNCLIQYKILISNFNLKKNIKTWFKKNVYLPYSQTTNEESAIHLGINNFL